MALLEVSNLGIAFGGLQAVAQLEIEMIKNALKISPSAAAAAKRLGLDSSTLSKKRKRYGL